MSGELDPQLESFITEYLDSFVSWDLILFFNHNPGVVVSVSDLAVRLGRSAESVEEELEKLIVKGVVKKKSEGNEVCYFYTPDSEFQKKARLFSQALENRLLRLKVLSLLLKKGVK